ncbi:hypothetical protein J45TS6_35800 [Paenibacillus sp. J45TS6]|uniref:dynamin family protein n=1 Tax=Paenibacillus sp. J45TS6 TaxID=2807196 RepID=UPI001B011B63|nr:dynamin family protein [Paenibacillus sp. J45TS6]GIP45121.1 hypothetical protein J45TS6_35800 [Paenibacillus sp. J45TS6]
MNLGALTNRAERISGFLNLENHPVRRKNYKFRVTYFTLLYAALQAGARNEEQVKDILNTYRKYFIIKDSDYYQIQTFIDEGNEKLFDYLRSLIEDEKFTQSVYSKLLFGEMLFFELNGNDEFNFNSIIRLYADYCKFPQSMEVEIKSLLIKMIAGEEVEGLFKLKRLKVFKYLQNAVNAYLLQEQVKSFNVTVIATMSSGKSTLLNALLGKKIFPSENKACTSTCLKFTNRPKQVREIGLATGQHTDTRWNLTYDDIARWNGDSGIEQIEVEGNMNSISMLKKFNISFIDTPGTNNSRNRHHEEITQEILEQKKSNVILYVLNAANLAPEDDKILLQQVIKHLGDQQIIFLLNKTDQLDLEAEDSIAESLNIAKSHLMELGVASPVIVPISSYAAGLFRDILDNRALTKRETRDALTLLELFRIPLYDMNQYIDRNLTKSLPPSVVRFKLHRNIQIGNNYINSKVIDEAIKKTGIHIVERLLLQSIKESSISDNGRCSYK